MNKSFLSLPLAAAAVGVVSYDGVQSVAANGMDAGQIAASLGALMSAGKSIAGHLIAICAILATVLPKARDGSAYAIFLGVVNALGQNYGAAANAESHVIPAK
jgi:hypothetical protein